MYQVESSRNEKQKARGGCCKIALDLGCYENLCSFSALADDEELELRECQAGPNPLTCGAHFATGGSHGCSLCKGLFIFFPLKLKNYTSTTACCLLPLFKIELHTSFGFLHKLESLTKILALVSFIQIV